METLDKNGLQRLWNHIISIVGEYLSNANTYTDTKIADLVNSAPETLDTLGELAIAMKDNEDIISILDSAITLKANLTDFNDVKNIVDTLSLTKKDIPNMVYNSETNLILQDNTEYRLTDISSLTITYPENPFEVWMSITFSSTGSINMVFPEYTTFMGSVPAFSNNETWEISIKDSIAICWRVK